MNIKAFRKSIPAKAYFALTLATLTCLAMVLSGKTFAQGTNKPSGADEAYLDVSKYDPSLSTEQLCRSVREKVINFWQKYPKDQRRFDLLCVAVNSEAFYLKNEHLDEDISKLWTDGGLYGQQIDEKAKADWERTYKKLRASFWNSPELSENLRSRLLYYELQHDLLAARAFRSPGTTLDWHPYQKLLLKDGEIVHTEIHRQIMGDFQFSPSLWGLDKPGEMEKFVEPFKTSPNQFFHDWAFGEAQVLSLKKSPLDLDFTAMDGSKVSLKDLRGKIVYIDIWSTFCSSCMERLPVIEELYKKHKADGLEVITVCLDVDSRRKIAVDAMTKAGLTCPTFYTGGDSYTEGPTRDLTKRFFIVGVPVTFLLGRDGKLISANTEHDHLEPAIQQALRLAAADRK